MSKTLDQQAKEFLDKVLRPVVMIERAREVQTPPQSIDVIAVPKPDIDHARAFKELGWLAKMTEHACLLEPYSSTPSVLEVRSCLRKQLAWDNERAREAERDKAPAPPLPLLWILSAGDPKTVIASYLLTARKGWPAGFRFSASGHAMCVVVLSDLERNRETLLLRLLGRDRVLAQAIEDAHEVEPKPLRRLIMELLARRRMVMLQSMDPEDRKEAAMLEQEFQKFKKEMRDEGRRELLRRQLTKKFGPLDDTTLARLGAADDVTLDMYADRILTASRLSEVFGD